MEKQLNRSCYTNRLFSGTNRLAAQQSPSSIRHTGNSLIALRTFVGKHLKYTPPTAFSCVALISALFEVRVKNKQPELITVWNVAPLGKPCIENSTVKAPYQSYVSREPGNPGC